MFAGHATAAPPAPKNEVSTGWDERRVVAEVAVELRISPKFSDDGTPEGTCERPVSIHLDVEPAQPPAGEREEALDLSAALVRAFHD